MLQCPKNIQWRGEIRVSKKWILSTGLALSVAIIGACSNGDGGENSSDNNNGNEEQQSEENSNNNNENNQQEESDEGSSDEQASGEEQAEELPEPDLSDVPDVVATVNGEEITKEEFEPIFTSNYEQHPPQAAASSDQSNEELQTNLKEQTAESLIDQELLTQEAEARDYEVNEEEINDQISSLREQFDSDEEYQQALEEQGYTEEELREEARASLQRQALLDEELEDVEVSDEEVEELYDQVGGEDAGSLEDLRPQLEQQLEQQKLQQQQQEYADQLREDADVENNIASESEGNSDSEE